MHVQSVHLAPESEPLTEAASTFEEFAATRLPAVLAFAAVLTGQRATAEDIAQEVLIRAHARWHTIGGLGIRFTHCRAELPRRGQAPPADQACFQAGIPNSNL